MSHSDVIIDLAYHSILAGTFNDVRQAGVLAVIHKAETGLESPDPVYFQRRGEAMEAGLLWGAYHVGKKTCNGTEQADEFLETVRSRSPKAKTLLALDYERYEVNLTKTMLPRQAEQFVDRIHEKTGFYPVVYGRGTLAEAVAKNPGSPLTKCDLWFAHYGEDPPAPPAGWDRWAIWQYTEHGSAGKAITNCDRNRFNGTEKELAEFWAAHSV